jgi:hypothetical protein
MNCLLILTVLLSVLWSSSKAGEAKPNFLIIIADDLC